MYLSSRMLVASHNYSVFAEFLSIARSVGLLMLPLRELFESHCETSSRILH